VRVYLLRRVLTLVPVVIGVTFLVFMMIHALPGDPVMMMLGQFDPGTTPISSGEVTEEQYDIMRRAMGLDKPLLVQYWDFLVGVLRGDFGESLRTNRTVAEMIVRNLPSTLSLTMSGLIIAVLLGLLLGTVAATFRNSWFDTAVMTFAVTAVSMPGFWFGLMLILLIAFRFDYFPIGPAPGLRGLVLPAVALGLRASGVLARLTRSSLVEVLGQEYIITARSKGLASHRVILKHALKNALIPVVTVVGLQFGALVSGAVIIETVFSRPGLGRMVVQAIWNQDFPVVQGVVLVSSLAYVLANLAVDLSYAFLDPRIRYG